MLGLIGTPPLPVKDALTAFYPLCTKGCVKNGMAPGHQDGWGISGFSQGRAVYFGRRAEPADQNGSGFHQAVDRASRGNIPIIIAHFRKASTGGMAVANTHPFHYKDWDFAHNGTVFGAAASLPLNESLPQGDTDSERLFLWIWERTHAALDPTAELVALLKASREQLVFTALNFLMSDGKTLWAYRDYGDKRMGPGETLADREKYYTLYTAQIDGRAAICSEPLSAVAKNWKPLEQRTLAVFTVEKPAFQTFKI